MRSMAVLKWWAVLVLCVGVAAAQAPAVAARPLFGPPECSPAAKAATPDAMDKMVAEQDAGARDAGAIPAIEPENFAIARQRLAEYGDCTGSGACYWADLDAQYTRAVAALDAAVAQHKAGEKLALVMDIDETTLTNYCEMKREDFGYISSLYSVWETGTESSTPITGALRLFARARHDGVAVFFITGRPGAAKAGAQHPSMDETNATARNLEAAGFHGWAGLALRTGDEIGMPTIQYKSRERRKIVAQGYRIVMSVGDQWSDLLGVPQAAVSVKLPNPFYMIP
jgi:hypothetical protein